MKSLRLPLGIALFAFALFAISIVTSIPALPDRVATHFNSAGDPDGWMSRTVYLVGFSAITLGTSFFMSALTYAVRFFPASMLSIPREDYWRSPENHPRACAFLFRHTLWLAALNLFFMRSVHQTIIIANLDDPPSLSGGHSGVGIAIFITSILLWIFLLIRFFFKAPRTA